MARWGERLAGRADRTVGPCCAGRADGAGLICLGESASLRLFQRARNTAGRNVLSRGSAALTSRL